MKTTLLRFPIVSLLSFASANLGATVLFPGGTYMQDFDGLHDMTLGGASIPNTGFPYNLNDAPFENATNVDGWYIRNAATNALAYRVYGDASGTGGGFLNFGLTAPEYNTDRALGGISNGSTALPQFGVVFENTSSLTISEVTISFAGEQWRGTEGTDLLKFSYQVGSDGSIAAGGVFSEPGGTFDFTGASSTQFIDGSTDGRTEGLGGVLSDLNWMPGDYLILRWTNDVSGAGLAIDDFSITAVPEPATYAMILGALSGLVMVLRRRSTKR